MQARTSSTTRRASRPTAAAHRVRPGQLLINRAIGRQGAVRRGGAHLGLCGWRVGDDAAHAGSQRRLQPNGAVLYHHALAGVHAQLLRRHLVNGGVRLLLVHVVACVRQRGWAEARPLVAPPNTLIAGEHRPQKAPALAVPRAQPAGTRNVWRWAPRRPRRPLPIPAAAPHALPCVLSHRKQAEAQGGAPARKQSRPWKRWSPSRFLSVNTTLDLVAALQTASSSPALRASSMRRSTPGRGSTSPLLRPGGATKVPLALLHSAATT